MLKKVAKTKIEHGEHYEFSGVIAPDFQREGSKYVKFGSSPFDLTQGGKGWGFVVITHEVVGKRKITHYIDVQAFDDAYETATELNLVEGERISVYGVGHVKQGDKIPFRSVRVNGADDISSPDRKDSI